VPLETDCEKGDRREGEEDDVEQADQVVGGAPRPVFANHVDNDLADRGVDQRPSQSADKPEHPGGGRHMGQPD